MTPINGRRAATICSGVRPRDRAQYPKRAARPCLPTLSGLQARNPSMWATLAIASALSLAPAQGEKLEIKNDRVTYGILGQERKDSKVLAGDVFVVTL